MSPQPELVSSNCSRSPGPGNVGKVASESSKLRLIGRIHPEAAQVDQSHPRHAMNRQSSLPSEPQAGASPDLADQIAIPPRLAAIHKQLEHWFETELAIVDTTTSATVDLEARRVPALREHWLDLCGQVALRGRPEFIACEEPLLVLAIPLPDGFDNRYLAVGLFLCEPFNAAANGKSLEQALGWPRPEVNRWARKQSPWSPSRLTTLAEAVHARIAAELRTELLLKEERELSANIGLIYEEISLLYRLTQNLRISHRPEELARWRFNGLLKQFLPSRSCWKC